MQVLRVPSLIKPGSRDHVTPPGQKLIILLEWPYTEYIAGNFHMVEFSYFLYLAPAYKS